MTVVRVLRVLLILVALAALVVVLFTWVFPWVEQRMEDPSIGSATPAVRGGSAQAVRSTR